MKTTVTLRAPLLCWDIYGMYLSEQAKTFNKQIEIAFLKDCKERFGWTVNIEALLTENKFEALVLTDANQDIKWVNKGFSKMTGYPAKFAIGKKPSFLQGEKSSTETRKSIKTQLKLGNHFREEIINYKKDGTPYKCEISVYQLKDHSEKTTHFLALENTLAMQKVM
jgi:PAS domain S-box-containing protein